MSCLADLRPPPKIERRTAACPFSLASGETSDPAFALEQATMLLDLEGTIVFCDEAGARLFRGRVADLIGRPIASLIADLPFGASTPGYNLAYVGLWFSNVLWQRHRGLNLEARAFPLELSLSALELGERHAFLLHLRRPRDLWPALAHIQRLASRVEDDEGLARERPATLSQQANYDRLTGLPNAGLFLDRLHQALGQAARREGGFCLLDIQLDAFRKIEAHYGAAAGERLLRALAQRFKHCVREEDTLARLGKVEFALILLDLVQREHAQKVLDKLWAALSQGVTVEGERVTVAASIGVCFYPEDGEDELNLLTHAERAMHHARAQGGGCYQFFSAPGAVRQISLFDEDTTTEPVDAAPLGAAR